MERADDGSISMSREEAHDVRAALFVATHHVSAADLRIFTGAEQAEVAALLHELDSVSQPDDPYWRASALESHFQLLSAMPDEELRSSRRRRHLRDVVQEARALGLPVPTRLATIHDEG